MAASSSSAGGKGPSIGQLYEKNRKVLEHHARKLKEIDKDDFTITCEKLGKWLADDRAFYEEVQPLIVECLENGGRALRDVCHTSRSGLVVLNVTCPPKYSEHLDKLIDLIASVRRRLHRFINEGLRERLHSLFESMDAIERPKEDFQDLMQVDEDSSTVNTSRPAPEAVIDLDPDTPGTPTPLQPGRQASGTPVQKVVIDLTGDDDEDESPLPKDTSLATKAQPSRDSQNSTPQVNGVITAANPNPLRDDVSEASSASAGPLFANLSQHQHRPPSTGTNSSASSPLFAHLEPPRPKPQADNSASTSQKSPATTSCNITSESKQRPPIMLRIPARPRKATLPEVEPMQIDSPGNISTSSGRQEVVQENVSTPASAIPSVKGVESLSPLNAANGERTVDGRLSETNTERAPKNSVASPQFSAQPTQTPTQPSGSKPGFTPLGPPTLPFQNLGPSSSSEQTSQQAPNQKSPRFTGYEDPPNLTFTAVCNSQTIGEEILSFNVTDSMEHWLENWVSRRGNIASHYTRYFTVFLSCFKTSELTQFWESIPQNPNPVPPPIRWPSLEEGPVWCLLENGGDHRPIPLGPPIVPTTTSFLDLSNEVLSGANTLRIVHLKALTDFTFVLRLCELPPEQRVAVSRKEIDFGIRETLRPYVNGKI